MSLSKYDYFNGLPYGVRNALVTQAAVNYDVAEVFYQNFQMVDSLTQANYDALGTIMDTAQIFDGSLSYAQYQALPIRPGASDTVVAGLRTDNIVATTPSRSLNSPFMPSAAKPVLCIYTVEISCTANLSGGQAGRVQLFSDANTTPTTERDQVYNENSVSLAIALTSVNKQRAVLIHLVPAGHYVKLVSTQVTGSPSISLVSQTEITLG